MSIIHPVPLVPVGSSANLTSILSPVDGFPAFATDTHHFYIYYGGSWFDCTSSSSSGGTVTSVALSAPSLFNVTGSPITTSGTLTFAFNSQLQNLFLASPNGSSGVPSMRAIVLADLPLINVAGGGTGLGTLTAHALLIGNGTGNVTLSAVGATGKYLGGNTGADPTWQLVKIPIDSSDTTPDYLANKLVAGSNITLTINNVGGNETITIASGGGGGGGGVTSVAMTVPSGFSVSGSPITTSGTLAVTLNSQSANMFLASPSGSSGVPTFRTLALSDLPGGVGTGTVTSVGLAVPGDFTITNSPITSSGTMTIGYATQSEGMAWMGANLGSGVATPAFRYPDYGLGTVEGRLTLDPNNVVSTTDQTNATKLYYLPYYGNRIMLYNGKAWRPYLIPDAGFSIPIPTGFANTNYDVFLAPSVAVGTPWSGVPGAMSPGTMVLGAIPNSGGFALTFSRWVSSALGSSSNSGLSLFNGVWVKTTDHTQRYLGSIRTTTAGKTEDSVLNRFVYNAYNRVGRNVAKVCAGPHNVNTGGTPQAWNGDSANNQALMIIGLNDTYADLAFNSQQTTNVGAAGCSVGLALDTAYSSPFSQDGRSVSQNIPGYGSLYINAVCYYKGYIATGYHTITATENTDPGLPGGSFVTFGAEGAHQIEGYISA